MSSRRGWFLHSIASILLCVILLVLNSHGSSRATSRKVIALSMGVVCHAAFFSAVGIMFAGLYGRMAPGVVSLQGAAAAVFDLALLIQFPLLHSFCLGRVGRRMLSRLFPESLGKHLVTTTFVIIASVQILLIFGLWAHVGVVEWSPSGSLLSVWRLVYGVSWLLLGVSMVNAGLGIQMGYKGWMAVVRDKEPSYGPFPQGGLYKVCRHPVYFAMAAVSCTGPVWNLDHAILSGVFITYCIVGPMFKDRRFAKMYGDAFVAFKESTPFFPTPMSCLLAVSKVLMLARLRQ